MKKPGVLFVDDEPNILSGIKRMLRPLRDNFEMFCAESGKEALSIMNEHSDIEIVVSDMRMPGMDGAELLYEIQRHYPQAVRIMLTGQADDESVVKTVSVVHQFLAKPCEPEKLKDVLLRAKALHDQVSSRFLKDIISGIDSLPSLPSVYAKLQEVLQDPEATADDIAVVIEQDMAMTAKLLQLVNSSFFGLFQKVESPGRAVKLLGLDTIKILVLGVQIFSELKSKSTLMSLDYLWKHSILTANCTKKIAMQETDDIDLINNCFIAGMLHDLGKLVFVSRLPEEYTPVIEAVLSNNTILCDEEVKSFQASHGDVGAFLVGLWGFNADILEAVAFHNHLENYPGSTFSAALAVHLADYCYYEVFPEESLGSPPALNEDYLKKTGYTEKAEELINLGKEFLLARKDEE